VLNTLKVSLLFSSTNNITNPCLVIRDYDLFLSYLENEKLLDVTELKPIANGNEVSASLGVRRGRWMSTALEMLIKWQLLHPEITEKDQALEELKNRRAELGV
jgi:tRNA nucleotidyltransferase (CCA-adding enzyme)